MHTALRALARTLGFALAVSMACMTVAWVIVMFAITAAGVDGDAKGLALIMGVFGLVGAMAGGLTWAIEVEGKR